MIDKIVVHCFDSNHFDLSLTQAFQSAKFGYRYFVIVTVRKRLHHNCANIVINHYVTPNVSKMSRILCTFSFEIVDSLIKCD